VIKKKASENLKEKIKVLTEKLQSNTFLEGESVLIKPNFNTADEFPASTSLDFLEATVDFLLDNNFERIIIGDSSTFYKNSGKVIARKNLEKIEEKDSVEIVNFDNCKRTVKAIPKGKYLKKASIPSLVDEVDQIIYLPCAKTHFHAEYTGSLKLSVGLMPGKEKILFHIRNLQEKIAELNKIIQPDLVLMDARKCFINGGPVKGTVRKPNELLASTDRVAIDIEEVKLIHSFPGNSLESRKPVEIPQIKRAIEMNIGSSNYQLINL